jgi:DNA polymerase (family 10)
VATETVSINDSNIQARFELKFAEKTANEILSELQSHFIKYQICGSIRRKKPTVGDIDIVAIPKSEYKFGEERLSNLIRRLDPSGNKISKSLGKSGIKRFLDGDIIKRFNFKGISVDIYLADENTFSTLVLIRTGSKEHNIKLTGIARRKGLKLFASGKGLCIVDDNDNITKIVSNNENEILSVLLDYIPAPTARD